MKSIFSFATAFALVAAFATATFAQDAQQSEKPLPKFKQDALSMWLSPSNQINNIGYGDYHSEKERMNEVADVVEPILKAQGIKVYRNDPKKTIREYTDEANELGVDLYFAIHSNASGAGGKARGTEAWCHRKGGEGERFAKRILDNLMTIYKGPNRGVKEGYNRFGDRPMHEPAAPKCASVLVEIAFHDNEEDATWIMDNIEPIGKALARAVLEHLAAEHPDALEE
ncbi:MAG: N-acetylmuramoyl-L-alanine amidase [Thermoguttaceae bacterium]|nr:N-acetylmuramoyl-L-alanine amidase [Thermoguttaceae bacterium]